jgi:uncharacterized Rmd1/YagE family protein
MVANRIDTRGLAQGAQAAGDPAITPVGARGRAFVFRDGAVALFEADPEEEALCLKGLSDRLREPLPTPVCEEATLQIGGEDQILPNGVIALRDLETPRVAIVAEVLAKAAALDYVEPIVEAALARSEPFAAELARSGATSATLRELGQRMGEALTVEHRLVGRAAIAEKPDLLWDYPELERLYGRLEAEYELRERALVLERKLSLLRANAEFVTELVQNRRSQLLEWAVIGLICFEIALSIVTVLSGRR